MQRKDKGSRPYQISEMVCGFPTGWTQCCRTNRGISVGYIAETYARTGTFDLKGRVEIKTELFGIDKRYLWERKRHSWVL